MANRAYRMTSRQPARRWQDALPSGNGTIGALVYGNIRHELILLNHEALWFRSKKPAIPSVSERLPELRKMLAQGRYRDAEKFLHEELRERNYEFERVDPYHPALDISIEMDTRAAFSRYERSVDFETGEVTVAWKEGGTAYERRLFVSSADNAVVASIRSDARGMVNCRIGLRPHAQMTPGKYRGLDDVPLAFRSSAEGEWLKLCAEYRDGSEFGGLARVFAKGGELKTLQDCAQVENAEEVIVIAKLFANEKSEAALKRLRAEISSLSPDYSQLLGRHAPVHRELFSRMALDLHPGEKRELANEQLLMDAYEGDVSAALIGRMFDCGRYLLVSSSRPEGLPASLQGIWNGDYDPPWACDFHNDENIQMNYWQALPGNLTEAALPYFDYYESSLPDYRENARAVYGCRGILAPISQSTHGMMHTGPWLNWTAGAGWLAALFYDYWLFTGDREFLEKRAVPFLREAALFYEDFLFEDERGKLTFSPSLSPENVPAVPGASLVSVNATMDVAIAKEALSNLCAACETLGIEQDGVRRWRKMLEKLPDYEINADGALKEWIHPDLADNYHHRHQSHLYPLFPGFEATEEENPALFEASRIAVEKRLVVGLNSQTGWSLAHMANIYARLGDGDRALECLELLCRSCVGPNLFTYHNDWRAQGITMFWGYGRPEVFQIDANFGLAAAVLEMLAFSKPGIVKLLPALPRKWKKGAARGMLCRGAIALSIEWDMEEKRLRAELLSRQEQEVTVKFPVVPARIEVEPLEAAVRDSGYGPGYRALRLPAGQKVALAASW
jgi:alpha-L-fucosidase 2